MIKQLCKNCLQNVILHQICCAQGQVLPLSDSAHFVRPRVCSANYPIIDFFWQDFVLQKIVRVRIPFLLSSKKAGHSFCYALFFMAESKGFEPSNRFRRLHDFQSCSFDQLGQLSIDQMTRNIIYDFIQKSKQIFSYYSKFTLSAHTHIKRSPMRLPSKPKTLIFLQS